MKWFDEVLVVDEHVVGITEEGEVYVAPIGNIHTEWELLNFSQRVTSDTNESSDV